MCKIISGGQTGIDQLSLDIAMAVGLKTGGTAAKGWMTEEGPMEELLKSYGLVECKRPGYPARTWQNILDSDATVWFGSGDTTGYYRTKADCKSAGKVFIDNPTADQLRKAIVEHNISTLNVAGNRGSKLEAQTERRAKMIMYTTFISIKIRDEAQNKDIQGEEEDV